MDYFLPGCDTAETSVEWLTYSGAGYVRDDRSVGINAPPTDQSDPSVFLENDITIHKRSHEARSTHHERVSAEEERVHKVTNHFKLF